MLVVHSMIDLLNPLYELPAVICIVNDHLVLLSALLLVEGLHEAVAAVLVDVTVGC